MSLHATSLPRHSHVGRVSHLGLHNVLGPTLSTGARFPRIRCTRPDTVNLVSHVHDVLGPTLSTWSLTYTMYSTRHCQIGLSRTRCTRPDTVDLGASPTYTMYSARHCQLGLSRTRCTRPDTVKLVSHVHDVGPTRPDTVDLVSHVDRLHDVLGPTLSTWSLTYPIHGRPVVRCRMLSSDARDRRSDTPLLVPNVTGSN